VNIVILNDAACIRGGADRVAFDSARGLAARGHRVVLFTAFGPVDESISGVPGLEVICLGNSWLRNDRGLPAMTRGLWNREAAVQLRGLLSRLEPADTIVHAHLYSSALSASVMDASMRAGFATVLTLHDYFITCPNGAYFVFPKAKLCERRALSMSCLACHCDSRRRAHKAWRVARTWLQNRVAKIPQRLTAYAAVSGVCETLARRDLPADAPIEVLPNIVGVERHPPVDAARNRSLVFTGRLENYKGPHLLAEAAARLNLPVTFCGTGPLEAELKQRYPQARFTGWVTPEQVFEELGQARGFVFPSVYRETFGLSAAEALARGIPVVASRGTAAEEFVHHDRNGLLFAHNSVDDLTVQLAKLADDSLVSRLGAEAYETYWQAPLTAERHLEHLMRFYGDALNRAKAKAGSKTGTAATPA
jgi:glycosyltransferase involved in cell wall biosynthesis